MDLPPQEEGRIFSNLFGPQNPEDYVDEEDNLTITFKFLVASRTKNGDAEDVSIPADKHMGASASFLANDILSFLNMGSDYSMSL